MVDACKIDALDQWCLRTLLGIKQHQCLRNKEVRRITKQSSLTVIIQSWRLSIFGHIARMDDDADAKMILTVRPPVLFCSLAFLDSKVGHTMDVLSPFISILCHSD